MRLLNTFTYEVRTFVVDVPHYAILSHTWGAEEVTYYDVVQEQGLEAVSWKQGYSKLMGLCKTAAQNGFKWVWMDSCCIDKSSSAELSEAINSMFAWYRDAVVCYVYLVDFVASQGSEFHFAVSGARSRWFTRGWTLQELLAPENVVFYDHNWKDSGSKRSLAGAISSITGVDQKILLGEAVANDYSVAQKMSWASMREVTRVEDTAYSLLGIFQINMPLLYGEGLRSFARLQQEIIRQSTDQTIFAWRIGSEWRDDTAESDFEIVDRGILATSPADFRESGRIVPASGQNLGHAKCDITNTGLMVDLPVRHEDKSFVGILNCHVIGHPNTRLGVLLKESTFLIEDTSIVDIGKLVGREGQQPSQRIFCQRVAPDLLRSVQADWVSTSAMVPLTINPLWIAPTSRASRFPLVDVTLQHDLDDSGFFLARSSSLVMHGSSRRLMSYIFGDSHGKMFGVKLQMDDSTREAVRSCLEVMVSSEAALEDWTTEFVATPLDQVEATVGDNEEWLLSANVRYRIKENRRGQILSLILRVSLSAAT
jgi:hypothetical protein